MRRGGYNPRAMQSRIFAVAAIVALAGSVPAQLGKGVDAPKFDFAKTWNGSSTSIAELKGKLILLEFFATW